MKNEYLRIIFYKRLTDYSQDTTVINGMFDELEQLYMGSKRYYHGITHIVNLLKLWEEHKQYLADDEVVYLAIWFHDAVYEAWKSDNEEQSAEMAKKFLADINFPADRAEKVVNYILATKTHESNGDNDLNFFLDFDLSILGADEAIYDVYAQQIKDEYFLYPSFIYNRGRKKAMTSFLQKEHIYKTEKFKKALEAPARANIQREIDNL
jgi:predicted metal-dependent HD superfamily phosphohydrolase